MFPNAQRLNRGNYVMSQLVHACRANDVTDLIIVHEHRGEPSKWAWQAVTLMIPVGCGVLLTINCMTL